MLFRPLLPWCFPIREVSFEQKESQEQQQEETGGKSIVSAAAAGGNRRKKWLKASFSMGFRSYIREFLAQFWCFSVLRCHGVFPSGRCLLNRRSRRSRSSSSRRKQKEKVVKIFVFCGFQKLHSGVFGRNFDACPSFAVMVFSHPGGPFCSAAAGGNRRKK